MISRTGWLLTYIKVTTGSNTAQSIASHPAFIFDLSAVRNNA